MTRNEARLFIEDLKKLRDSATDAQASVAVNLYPDMTKNGALVKAGTRIRHNGKILRVAVDMYDTEENSPENAPTLYEEIEYKEGIRIIPETITVGKAFAKDERGWWKDEIYKSLIDANVYTPDAYPAGWSKEG